MGGIYLCATPLGNLEDITLRVLRLLKEADLIAAEDTRHTAALLSHFGIKTPLTSYHEHNERMKTAQLLEQLARGKTIAVVSDAGMPCVSDPGYILVQAVLEAGYPVTALPGPSALITALALSGFTPYPFYFQGFLPRSGNERRQLLDSLKDERRTGVFYEAPHRLTKTMEDFCSVWGEERRIAVARELTKQFEEVVRGSCGQVWRHFQQTEPRGEITLVAAGAARSPEAVEERNIDDPAVRRAVSALIEAGADLQSACKGAAQALGLPKSAVYRSYHQDP